MKTRVGKIARLPKEIREQLNQRLENGEPGKDLVPWLNQLPETQKIVAEHFAGQPIRAQNLSDWKNGGYQDWLRHQQLREQTRWTAEQSTDLENDIDRATISIAENIAIVMSAELAVQLQALGEISDTQERFRQFRFLARELSRLRRDDQRIIRIRFQREKFLATFEPVIPEASTSENKPSSPSVSQDAEASSSKISGNSRNLSKPLSLFPRHQPSQPPSIPPNPA